jgi:broad specificity phosphatase PhoE
MKPLFLIRHAPVTLELDRPSDQWTLTSEGIALAQQLAALPIIDSLDAVYTSPEPKARETARPLAERFGLHLLHRDALRELDRGPANLPGRTAYDAAVERAFSDPEQSMNGWERAVDAQTRIVACVREADRQHAGPIAIVSHGLVLSLLLAHLREQPRVDFAEWRAIALPALAIVDRETWRVAEPFGSVEAWNSR